MRRVLLIGATSAIVEAVGRHFADDGDSIYLLGRSLKRMQQVADDYRLRGAASVDVECFDALNYAAHSFRTRPLAKRPLKIHDRHWKSTLSV
jgi:NADP-dependent 3-hydroxy acid dehydrogenase YdfG